MPGMRRAPCETSSMQHAVCSVHRAAQRAPLTGVIMFNLGNTYAEERNYPLSIKSGPRTTRLPEYPAGTLGTLSTLSTLSTVST